MLASILINSNNKSNLEKVFNSYEKNASSHNSFEFIINIDDDDNETKQYLEEQIKKRKFIIKYIESYEGDYFSGHINNNKMLSHVDESAYFISCTGDRVLNETKNWDKKLEEYKKIFSKMVYFVSDVHLIN